jgi:response regulator RpfG family c-di-GMP phosphodiesterase/signal transduction histidine kinase
VLLAYLLPIFIFDRVTDWPIFTNNTTFLTGVILFTNVSNFYDNLMREQEFRSRYRLQRANEKLKQLDVMKSQFFANVSHEVRTPLTSILAPIQSLYLGDVGGLSREQHRLIGQVYRNSLRLLDMINQMLDFSRFEAGKMSLRLGSLNLDEVAQDASALFEEVANRKGLKLVFVREGIIPPVFLDVSKVERVLTNLIRNALKFTDQGTVSVRVGREPGKVILEVEDTGIGIPERHLPNIFKRFQQVDGSSTRKYEGTGLGLTIVKESVDLMRGIISVRSREGQGSCFRVELPDNLDRLEPAAFIERRACERRRMRQEFNGEDQRRQIRRRDDLARVTLEDLVLIERDYLPRQVEPVLEEEERTPAADAARVLLIEDNTDLRNYIGRMLKSFGHRVMTTCDGWEGWQRIQSELPDLIVSDVMMPRMDGYELLRQVKGNPRTRHIPIILITAKSEVESRIQGLMTGADDYLAKPVNVRELDARIRNLITSRKLQRAMALASELDARMDELSLSFSESLELRDANTAGHSREVLDFGLMIAQELALPIDRTLKESLLLHDIGKLGIPDRILFKESSLDEQEWKIMKRHPELGESLLGKFSYYRDIGAIILAHQECYNGTGYPRGLREEEIPLIARIVAVADAYHAMTTDRPYRKALSAQHALDEIIRNSGTQFDPRVVEAFLRGLEKRGAVYAAAHQRNAPPRTAGF